MKRAPLPVMAATAVLVLVSGCAQKGEEYDCDDGPDPAEVHGEALPIEIEPSDEFPGITSAQIDAAVPELEGFPSVTEQVLTHLRTETLTMAGAVGETDSGECEGDVAGSVGATTLCTVTYEGMEVQWAVEITGVGQGLVADTDYEYAVRLEQGVLTARMVYEQLAWDTQEGHDRLPARCDDLPDLFAAEPGKATGHHCQTLGSSCSDGVERYWWDDAPVGIDEEGFVDFSPTD